MALTEAQGEALYRKALEADKAFGDALKAKYGKAAGDMRYRYDLPEEFAELKNAKLEADEAYLSAVRAARLEASRKANPGRI